MDTRTKIVNLAEACARLAGSSPTMVTGYFDVLRAAHVRELNSIGARPLVAVVRPVAGALLSTRARAELVAALRMIDYVVTADDGDFETLLTSLQPARVVHLEDADRKRVLQLKQHVQRRQSS